MRLIPPSGLLSMSNKLSLLFPERLTNPGLKCILVGNYYAKCSLAQTAATTTFWDRQDNLGAAKTWHYFTVNTFFSCRKYSTTSITSNTATTNTNTNTNNNNNNNSTIRKSFLYENKKTNRLLNNNCFPPLLTTIRNCFLAKKKIKTTTKLTNPSYGTIGLRSFSTSSSGSYLTGSGGKKEGERRPTTTTDISHQKQIGGGKKATNYNSPCEFMAQLGVKPGSYVNFLLEMTPLETDDRQQLQQQQQTTKVYRGSPLYIHTRRKFAFGGSLMGQALSAAVSSVPQGLLIHSFHNYFLNAGQVGCVDYHVKNVRNGNTYCNRFVEAMQNDKNIVNMQVSFKKDESDPFEHQHVMPDCKGPEELISAWEHVEAKLRENFNEDLKKILKDRLPVDPVVEFRPLDPETIYRFKPLPPKRLTWVKIIEKLGDDQNLHRCGLAFLSDYIIITTALLPNDQSSRKFFLTSLDHSVWFHNKFRVDDWLLYETESCHTGGGVGFATGRFWTKEGLLVASVAQQGVIRSLL